MSQLIDVHTQGEVIFSTGAGRLRAYIVLADGSLKDLTLDEAFKIEENR